MTANGQIVGKVPNPAVEDRVLVEILQWRSQGIEWSNVIARLRPRTVPSGYAFISWKPGMLYSSAIPFTSD